VGEVGIQAVVQPWEPMAVTLVGRVPDVIRHGGGKLSCYVDPGGPRHKPQQER
jgi:hypothetical protein